MDLKLPPALLHVISKTFTLILTVYTGVFLVALIEKVERLCNPLREPELHLDDETKERISRLTKEIIAKHRTAIVERILFPRSAHGDDSVGTYEAESVESEALRDTNVIEHFEVDIMTNDLVYKRECSICLEECDEEMSDKISLSCNHVFHKDCLVPWLQCGMSCPECRAPVFTLGDMVQTAIELKLVGNVALTAI